MTTLNEDALARLCDRQRRKIDALMTALEVIEARLKSGTETELLAFVRATIAGKEK